MQKRKILLVFLVGYVTNLQAETLAKRSNTPVADSKPNPCQNGGTYTRIDRSSLPRGPKFICTCPKGFSGIVCQFHVCDKNDCQNGTCEADQTSTRGYRCNCIEGYVGENCEALPMDCKQIQESGTSTSGVYQIFPDGDPSLPVKVFCDLETQGGGWTKCCPCENRGKCKSCVCKRRGCTNCINPICQFKTNATVRLHPYAANSARNVRNEDQPSRNEVMAAQASPENARDEVECVNLMAAVDNMTPEEMRTRLRRAITACPEFMQPFIIGQQHGSGQVSGSSNSSVPWCSCGGCQIYEDPRMNICCRQSPCVTSKPEFRNLCLRHDVLEIANILNWSFQTNQDPSFCMSKFRNQAYRNFILWQHGRLGAGRRIPVPACVTHTVRLRFPQSNRQYTGYHSAHSDSD